MQKIRLLMLFMIFAGSMLAQQDSSFVFVQGTVYNLGENTVTVDVLLDDGQTAQVTTSGNGYYFAQFDGSGNAAVATSSIINCEGDVVSNSGVLEFFGSVQIDLNYCGDEIIGGCMDPTANNYDENATYDDGSCDYCDNTDATLYVCTFSNGGNVGIQILGDGEVIFEQFGFNDVEIAYIPICLDDDVCYEVNMSNSQETGWYGGYYWVQVDGVEIANEFLDDDLSSEADNFSLNGDACPAEGCTNPDALNYDSEAEVDDGSCITVQDCDGTLIVVEIQTGLFAEEMSWYITSSDSLPTVYGQLYSDDNSTFYDYACLQDGCYNLHMFDGFGDGWNGGSITITVDGVTIAAGEIETGNYNQVSFGINSECDEAIGGCTDPAAENYDPMATYEDGSCTYDNGGCNCTQDYDPVCAWTLDVFTGDSILYTYTNPCWAECSDALIAFDGPCDPIDIFGCMDSVALNYNGAATIDDGSCIYAEDCDDNLVTFTMVTGPWAGEIGWTIGPDSAYFGGYSDNGVYTHILCLEDGCHDIYMMDSFGDGWNGAVLTIDVNGVAYSTTLSDGFGGTYTFGINSDDCLPADVYGCTDPLALNYNFLATVDDGSCYYDNGNDSTYCAAEFILFPDSLGGNTIWAINVSSGLDLDYLWDFGDGNTSTDPFPMHTYDGDGPYELCLTVSSSTPNGVVCEDTFCATIGAFMFPGLVGDGVGAAAAAGFTLNIIEDIDDISNTVEDFANVQNVQVYPNPANDQVSISLDATRSELLQVKLYSINGQQISNNQWSISSGNTSKMLDLEGLDSGIYMISITGEHTQLQERIIKL